MTRKEKEKLVLDALGLKVGDVVEIVRIRYKIKESDTCYKLNSIDTTMTGNISLLVDFNFLTLKKKKGELYCGDVGVCTKCPFYALNCDDIDDGNLYSALEDLKKYMPCKAYEEYKKMLDEEVEDD